MNRYWSQKATSISLYDLGNEARDLWDRVNAYNNGESATLPSQDEITGLRDRFDQVQQILYQAGKDVGQIIRFLDKANLNDPVQAAQQLMGVDGMETHVFENLWEVARNQ